MSNTNSLVTTTVLDTKISQVKNKILDFLNYFSRINGRKFCSKIKKADLMNKTDFDNKLTSFSKQNI